MSQTVLVVVASVAAATAIGAAAVVVARCLRRPAKEDLLRAFLSSQWVGDSDESGQPSTDDEVTNALVVHARSRGRAPALAEARRLLAGRAVRLKFACPSTDTFAIFLDAECLRAPEARCELADLRDAFARFAGERGIALGRRALSRARLVANLKRHGLSLQNDVVEGLSCSVWA